MGAALTIAFLDFGGGENDYNRGDRGSDMEFNDQIVVDSSVVVSMSVSFGYVV